MVLNFQKRFEPKIRSKEKRHTIRAKRNRRPIRVGDRLDCYVGLRQKGAYLLGRWLCVKIQDVWINFDTLGAILIAVDGTRLELDECEALAISDGFESFADMMKFWKGRLPFHGDMIHWDPDRPQDPPRSRQHKAAAKAARQTIEVGQVWKRSNGSRFTIERVDRGYAYYWLATGSKPQFRSIALKNFKRYKRVK